MRVNVDPLGAEPDDHAVEVIHAEVDLPCLVRRPNASESGEKAANTVSPRSWNQPGSSYPRDSIMITPRCSAYQRLSVSGFVRPEEEAAYTCHARHCESPPRSDARRIPSYFAACLRRAAGLRREPLARPLEPVRGASALAPLPPAVNVQSFTWPLFGSG